MGVWEFLDEIEERADDAVEAVGRGMGQVADKAAHVVGDGLDGLGLHSAAEAVDGFGDSVADTLGAQVGEAQLGQSDDPKKLVHGDPGALQAAAGHLAAFGAAFGKTADGLKRIDTAHWTGDAADKFRAQYHQHPAQWSDAAEACTRASAALTAFADVVQWAQAQAAEAARLYAAARRQSEQARTAYDRQAVTGARLPPFTDPGVQGFARAQQLLNEARSRRNTEGDRAKAALETATAKAPAEPRFTDRLLAEGGDLVQEAGDGLTHFYGGMVKGAGDILKFGRSLNPLDPYNMTHPAEYVTGLSGTAAGLLHTMNHPLDVVQGMLGDGWGSDPFEALGKLVPNVALTLATDGAGAAGERVATAGGEAAESAAMTAGRDAAESAVAAERPAAFTERPLSAPEDFGPTGHDFGPGGHDPTPPAKEPATPPGWSTENPHEAAFDKSELVEKPGSEGPRPPDAEPPHAYEDPPVAQQHEVPGTPSPGSDHPPAAPPEYSGDTSFRAGPADHGTFRDAYEGYDRHASAIQDVVAQHPEYAGIPEGDLVGIRGYTTSDYYGEMNHGLREGDPALLDKYEAHAKSAVSGLNQLPPYEGTVFRGIQVDDPGLLRKLADGYQPGSLYEERAFFSTDSARPFGGNVQYEVYSTGGGRDVRELSAVKLSESEVLFPPGSRFKVLSSTYNVEMNTLRVVLRDLTKEY